MDYGLFLYADLATGERIEILKRNFGGAPRKIAALSSWSWRPLDNDSAEVTDTPIVKGTLSLSIKDMRDFDYTAFFTVDSTLWRVVLKYGGVVRWSGYVQPESYSSNSEYRSDINIMALDNLGQLEHIEYNYFDSSFVSLRTLVSKACELVGWNFAPVIFDTRVVSGEGILIEDAVLNVETFRKKTWWEVLSDVLFSFGLQLAYFDDNAYRISSVANKFDATRIVNIPSYTIESGCTSDIVPPWKSASVEQNLQIINDFFYFPSGSDYSAVGSYIINAYNSKYEGIPGIPLTDWSLISSKINTLKPNNWQDNDCRTFSGQSVLNDKTGALYLETIIKETDPTTLASFVSKQIDIPTVLAGASIELSLSNREWYVLWEDYDYSDFTEDNPLAIRGYAQKFAPWVVQNFEIQYSFQMLYTYIDNDGVQQTIIFKEYWEKLSESNKDSRVEFTITPKKDTEVSDEKYTINIDSFPSQGSLELKIFRPKLLNTGSVVKEGATSFCRISDIKMATLPKIEIGSTKTNVGIIKSARTKKDLSLSYGELPPKYTCVDYAGGVFQNVRFNPSLHDWHRADNLGGVLPLSEIVWRGYVHHFSRFQTNAGEPAGGKVLRGRFPLEGLKLNNTLKYSTKEFTEYYVINSASITGREADLTLMQVIPYAHYTDFDIENVVETGGGSFASGGGDTYITHVSGGGGGSELNGKRLFALDEAADDQIDDLYLLADKSGNPTAQKIKARTFARRTHAKQHFKGGADEIKPYDIGAARRAGDDTQDFAAQNLNASRMTVSQGVQSSDFQPSLTGARIHKNEYDKWVAEFDTIIARYSIETPELIKNRVTVANNKAWFANNGVVADVQSSVVLDLTWKGAKLKWGASRLIKTLSLAANERLITISKDKGAGSTFVKDDLLWGYVLVENGNQFSLQTVNLTVRDSISPYTHVVTLDNGIAPMVDLILVQVGNTTNPERQNSIFVDGGRPAMFYYKNVNSHNIGISNIAEAQGNLRGYNFGALSNGEITEKHSHILDGDMYLRRLYQISGDSAWVIPIDRGAWTVGRYNHYDRVSHLGSLWLCKTTDGTAQEPSHGTDWELQVSAGAKGDEGAAGAMPRERSLYDPSSTYVWNDEYRDFVAYLPSGAEKPLFYGVRTKGASLTNITPTNSDHWIVASEFDFLHTELLLADKAFIKDLAADSVMAENIVAENIDAKKGRIAGFNISAGTLTGEKSPSGGFFSLSSDGESGMISYSNPSKSQFVRVGANTVSAVVGRNVMFNITNNEDSYGDVNYGATINVTNPSGYSVALKTRGNIVSDGLNLSHNIYEVTPPYNTALGLGFRSDTIFVRSIYERSAVVFPTRGEICHQLGLHPGDYFSVRCTIIIGASSTQGGLLYGRTGEIKDYNTSQYPWRLNNNGDSDTGGWAYARGDIFEYQLVYDGTYRAYLLNHRD